jgi:hypothetical protein
LHAADDDGTVGVIVAALLKISVLPAWNVRLVVAVRSPPKLRFATVAVDSTGLLTPPNVKPPLKLIVSAPVMMSLPELRVRRLL